MKLSTIILVTLCSLAPLWADYNRDIQLEAIRLVENTKGWGKYSEFGPHQLTKSVRLRVGGHDKTAAMKWLLIVEGDMKRYGIDLHPFNIACVWNAGINSVRKGRIPQSTYDYANRVCNMMEILHRTQKSIKKVESPRFELTTMPKFRFVVP